MKQEATKKSKLWLWLVIGIVALVAIAGVVCAILFAGPGNEDAEQGPTGGRPEIYWNVDRADFIEADTGMSAREPAEDGSYYITFAFEGQQLELAIADKQLVNYIDSMDVMGLVFDENGTVIDAVDVNTIAKEMAKNFVVQSIQGDVITLDSSVALNGMEVIINRCELTKFYNVTDSVDFKGQEIQLEDVLPMDFVTVYGNDLGEATHFVIIEHPVDSPVYWRTAQFYNSTLKETTRVPDENGVYSIEYFVNGERVTVKCKDKDIVTAMDKPNKFSCHTGLIFDEDGYVIDLQSSFVGIRGKLGCTLYETIEVNGTTFTAQRQISGGNEVGQTYTNTWDENTEIYDVSFFPLEEDRGKLTESLQVGDRLTVFEDSTGKPIVIFVSHRLCDSPMYFNMTKQYDSTTKETKRTPVNGWYTIELFVEGQVRTFRTQDKDLMTQIDKQSSRSVGLEVEGDVIKRVWGHEHVCGYGSNVGYYVDSITSIVMTVVNSTGTTSKTSIMNSACKVYNMSGIGGEVGSETQPQESDYVIILNNPAGEAMYVYILQRKVDVPIYYLLDGRKYSGTTQQTTRVPNEEGYYVFKAACNGQVVELKTPYKSVATKVDKLAIYNCVALSTGGGIIYDAYTASASTGGQRRLGGYYVSGWQEDGTLKVYSKSSSATGNLTLSEDCRIYNVSMGYSEYRGERTYSVQYDDMVVPFTDKTGKVVIMFIANRKFDAPFCWHVKRMYDSATQQTTREPDEEGYYVFEIVYAGEIKTFKTKDKDIATEVDSKSAAFSLRLKGDIITGVIAVLDVNDIDAAGLNGYSVVSVEGNKLTIENAAGEQATVTLHPNYKAYDMSSTADPFGSLTQLQPGDKLRTYKNSSEQYTHLIVLSRYYPRVMGETGLCEHCNEVVTWKSWGGEALPAQDGHYYLCTDVKDNTQVTLGNDAGAYDVVIDLNGKTLDATTRAFLVYKGSQLSIVDSVGTGKIQGRGVSPVDQGGVIRIANPGVVNLYGGVITQAEDANTIYRGGVIYVNGTNTQFNMYGGSVENGVATAYADGNKPQGGGNIYINQGTVNLYGGTVAGGQVVDCEGENIYIYKGTLNVEGGTVDGGIYTYTEEAKIAKCEHCNEEVTWTSWTGAALPVADGHYYLVNDVKDNKQVSIGSSTATCDIVIDLNGKTLESNYRAFLVYGNLSIVDSVGGGKVLGKGAQDGDQGAVIRIASAGHVSLYGGTYSVAEGAHTAYRGGVIYVNGAATGLDVYNDVVIENGVATYQEGGKTPQGGGNIFINAGTVNLYGGTVTGGQALEGCEGDNIYNYNGTLNIAGGTVDGGVYEEGATPPDEPDVPDVPDVPEVPAAPDYNAVYEAAKAMTFTEDGQTLACPACGKDVVWNVLPAADGTERLILADGHYYVAADLNNTQLYQIDGAVCINLNGKNITSTNSVFYTNKDTNGTLTVMGDGVVTGCSETRDEEAVVLNQGTMYLCGGTYTRPEGSQVTSTLTNHGSLYVYEGAQFEGYYYGIRVTSGKAQILGGKMAASAYVRVAGSGKLHVAGTPEIGTLQVAANKLTVGELAEGAKINITIHPADGVFTEDIADAAAVKDFFSTTIANKEVAVSGNALAIVDKATEPDEPDVPDVPVVPEPPVDEPTDEEKEIARLNALDNSSISEKFAEGTTKATCPYCQEEVEWTALTAITANTAIESGHYYLAEDVESSAAYTLAAGKEICVHLNGKTLSSASAVFSTASSTAAGESVLNLMGEGIVTTSTENVVFLLKGNANLLGGTIKHDHGVSTASILLQRATGVLNLYNGVTFDLDEGKTGGSISVTYGTLNIYGGNINKGIVKITGQDKIQHHFNMYGGTIADGISIGNLFPSGSFTISGDSVILPNNGGLKIASGKLLTVGELGESASIAVTADGVFTTELADLAAADKFSAANSDEYKITIEGGALACVAKPNPNGVFEKANAMSFADPAAMPTTCPACNTTVTWEALPVSNGADNVELADGHYYVAESLTNTRPYSVAGNVCIHLNGNDITSEGWVFAPTASANLSVMGTGVVTGAATTGGAVMSLNGTLNLYGGTFHRADSTTTHVFINPTGNKNVIVNIYEGTVVEATGEMKNNLFRMMAEGAQLNIFGGELKGTAVRTALKAQMSVSGSPVVENMQVAGENVLIIDGLTNDARINVASVNAAFTDGVFTTEVSDVTALKDVFTTTIADKAVGTVGNAFAIVDAVVEPEEPEQPEEPVVPEEPVELPTTCVCGASDVTWTALPASGELAAGHYFVESDIALTAPYTIAADANVCIHLAGKNITSTDVAFDVTTGKLYIHGEGNIVGAGATDASTIRVNGGALNLMGGTVKHDAATKNPSVVQLDGSVRIYDGAVLTADEGTVGTNLYIQKGTAVMYGGEISNGVADKTYAGCAWGGNVLIKNMNDNAAGMYMYGGTITGGTAEHGGNIGLPGHYPGAGNLTIRVYGGTISNGVANSEKGGVGGNIYGYGTTHKVILRVEEQEGTPVEIFGGQATNGGNIALRYSQPADTSLVGVAPYFAIRGGDVFNGVATGNGGNIYLVGAYGANIGQATEEKSDGSVTTYQPTEIYGGQAVNGGNIYASGISKLTVDTVGTVRDGVATENGPDIYLTSKVKTVFNGTVDAEKVYQEAAAV